ncbi:MAG: hypothetical protein U0521_17170 [Anaerolineae bacterium]
MIKNDGSVITGWTGAAASVSKDGATAASATNTPTEIASSFGVGYLDLTATEMNADAVARQGDGDQQRGAGAGGGAVPAGSGRHPGERDLLERRSGGDAGHGGYPKVTIKDGTGAGEIDLTSGKVDVNDKTGFGLADGGEAGVGCHHQTKLRWRNYGGEIGVISREDSAQRSPITRLRQIRMPSPARRLPTCDYQRESLMARLRRRRSPATPSTRTRSPPMPRAKSRRRWWARR